MVWNGDNDTGGDQIMGMHMVDCQQNLLACLLTFLYIEKNMFFLLKEQNSKETWRPNIEELVDITTFMEWKKPWDAYLSINKHF